MAKKHIFIGLGGSGCQTVSLVKKKIYDKLFPEESGSRSRMAQMNDTYRFLFIDTDSRDIEEANKRNHETYEHGRVPFISPQTDLVALGRSNPQSVYFEAKQSPEIKLNQRILEACSEDLAARIPDQALAFGAGAFRMKSRIAFAHSLAEFQQKLQADISALNSVRSSGGEENIIFYWVVGSTNGGTGSGIVNDVLYHVNMMHRQTVGGGDPQLILTMYMPKFYIDNNNTEEKYSLNAFAVFKEVNAFKRMAMEPDNNTLFHRMALVSDYNLYDTDRKYTPFYYLIPIDIQTDKGTSMGSSHEMYSNTAELLYNIHAGKGGDTFRSDIDNYMNDIMDKNHEDFLVPMGYVALRKPNAELMQYMDLRLKRDLLSYWLLNDNVRDTRVTETGLQTLFHDVFQPVESDGRMRGEMEDMQGDIISGALSSSVLSREELPSSLSWNSISSMVSSMTEEIRQVASKDAVNDVKKEIANRLWKETEILIRDNGLNYAINMIDALREMVKRKYYTFEREEEGMKSAVDRFMQRAMEAEAPAQKRSIKERTIGSNKEDIKAYHAALVQWANSAAELEIETCLHNVLHDFCCDEKTDELALLQNQLGKLKVAALDMRKEATKSFQMLADSLSRAGLDVTTVYLPRISDICNGKGWISGNIFSKLYTAIIAAHEDEECSPYRNEHERSLKRFVDESTYLSEDEDMKEEMRQNEYFVSYKTLDPTTGQMVEKQDYRFFANPNLDRKGEKIVEDFVMMILRSFEKAARSNKFIQERWYNKKISSFFFDLTNEEREEVRRSLNPALFFNYNVSRIETSKKEEHIVFVANNEEMAQQMLGYQPGNPKHRFESHEDIDSALVIKSKYGLSFRDYRIYDSLEAVYNNADNREKYHFHGKFAEKLDDITLSDFE